MKFADLATEVCPRAPGNAQTYVNEIQGYVQWGVLAVFTIALIVGVGGVVIGRMGSSPTASRAGAGGLAVVFIAAIGYMILPSIVDGIVGKGCV